eukprot:TRINITY_DN27037_c0_g1_i1.p2 TRINITY_DN27037_c0_g1~~TRINITY_DN27037_c0_g1_i1.p2  ORF type:complete len:376 (+),score=50.74 TRINITY_DN27037_c0_g1_i1:39-1166(+)
MSEIEGAEDLLWNQLRVHLTQPEAEQIIKVVGRHYVEDNEVLYNEWLSFSHILEDYTTHNEHKIPPLKPPRHQEILENHVRTLLTEMEANVGLFEPTTPRERAVVEYIRNPHSSRPSSSLSTSSRPSSSCSSLGRSSSMCVTPEIQQKLNILEVDEIVQELRNAFEEERQTLLESVEELKEQLNEEIQHTKMASFTPTTNDLSGVAQKLNTVMDNHRLLQRLPDTSGGGPPVQTTLSSSSSSSPAHSLNRADSFQTPKPPQLQPLIPRDKRGKGKIPPLSHPVGTTSNIKKAVVQQPAVEHPCVVPETVKEEDVVRAPTPAEIVAARFSMFDDLDGFDALDLADFGKKKAAPPATAKTGTFRSRFPLAAEPSTRR